MPLLALIFVLGAWLLQQMPFLPSLLWLAVLLPVLAALYKYRNNLPIRSISLALLALIAGFMWAALYAQWHLADELPPAWEGQDIQLIGVVASMPQQQERGERFEFDVERILTPHAVAPRHLSLSQYNEFGGSARFKTTSDNIPKFHAGERWQLTVRLKRPHGTLNPHGFDFEAWALERNIRATGYVRKDAANHKLGEFVIRPAYVVEMVREKIRERMSSVLRGQPYGGVLQALAIGDESAVAQPDWQIFLRTGTNHLVSISGLHITMLAGMVFGCVYALWRRMESLTLKLPARKAATVAGAVAALLYALVAGFSVPTQRTLYMLTVFAVALWAGRNISIVRVLALALLLVVVVDPWAVLAPGFWLSFGAVAVIAYALGGRLQRPHWLRDAVFTQWAVSLGLVPLLLVLFQQVSIISPLANAFAIPLISLLVVPLTLLGSLLPLDWPLQLAHMMIAVCMQCLQWLAALPLSTWQQHSPPAWTLPLALLGVLWMLLPRGFPMRWLGLAGLLPMLLLVPPHPLIGAMQVAVLDVGQGLAVVIRTAGHALLYDTGPRYSSQSDSGSRIVVPYLRGAGVARLNGIVISHDDNDHSGGMASVLEQLPVEWVASSLPAAAPELALVRHMRCSAGQSWTWDGVFFEMLHPLLDSYEDPEVKDNNRSCVLRISSRYGSLLLPGDIERAAEHELLGIKPEQLAANILLVPHHGSKTSSTAAFVAAVQPQVAIFTVGYRNRFGHPKQAVVDRYNQLGSQKYRSDKDGALLLDFSGTDAIRVTRWRKQARRYWHDLNPQLPEDAPSDAGLLAETGAAR
ncbi:MAG TPA: DNA internalization-related competence protein ComEC/Rec2 [Methylophilaceae bacterium]|nr:DNA internalization-related competence protein ComEC/Rec2 [Methylophilaceae bacterium]